MPRLRTSAHQCQADHEKCLWLVFFVPSVLTSFDENIDSDCCALASFNEAMESTKGLTCSPSLCGTLQLNYLKSLSLCPLTSLGENIDSASCPRCS